MAITMLSSTVNISPVSSTPSWVDVNLTGVVPATATAALIRIRNESGFALSYGFRKNGSSDTIEGQIDKLCHNWQLVGLDSGLRFEFSATNWNFNTINLQVWGYTEDDFVWFDSAKNITPTANGAYQTVDVSAHAPTGAVAAAIVMDSENSPTRWFARPVGSSDDYYVGSNQQQPFIVGLNAARQFQCKIASGFSAGSRLWLVGYFASGLEMETSAIDITPAASSVWSTVSTVESQVGVLVFSYQVNNNDLTDEWGVRSFTNGTLVDKQPNYAWGFGVVGAFSNKYEVYSDDPALVKLYQVGKTTPTTILGVDDATHGHTADSPDFTQIGVDILDADSVTHAHSADATTTDIVGFQFLPQVMLAVLEPRDFLSEREATGLPAAFGAVPFGGAETFTVRGAANPLYFADGDYTSGPSDTPANTVFLNRLLEAYDYEQALWTGAEPSGELLDPDAGQVRLANADGALDQYLDLAWLGRPVSIYTVPRVYSFNSATRRFVGEINAMSWNEGSISIQIRSRRARFAIPLERERYGGAGELDGDANLAGLPRPQLWGRAFNIPAVLIDPINLIYQIHDRDMNAIESVRDAGVPLVAAGDVNSDDLVSTTVSAGTYVTALNFGLFKIGASPAGQITCDAQGDTHGSTYVQTVPDIIKRVAQTRLPQPLTDSEIDGTFEVLASTQMATAGIWVGPQEIQGDEIVESLMATIHGFPYFQRDGRFAVGRLTDPDEETATITVSATTLSADNRIRLIEQIPPIWRRGVAYQRMVAVQGPEDLAGSVSDADRALYGQQVRLRVAELATNRDIHVTARNVATVGFFANQADADAEVIRLASLYRRERRVYEVGVAAGLFNFDVAQIIRLKLPRFGLDDGKNFIVRKVAENWRLNEIVLELWG